MSSRFIGIGMPKIEFDDLGPEEVTTLPPPDSITLSLSQPGTMPFKPIVEVGDKVQAGQFIALQPNRTGIHSSITGVVSFIGPGFSREGEEVLTINIRAEGDDELVPPVEVKRLRDMTRGELIVILAELGFQSPWKPESLKDQLMDYERVPVKTVVVLAVDGEPPIAVQRRFLTEFARDLSDSIVGLRYLTEDARIVVAVPENMAAKAKEIIREKVDIHPVKNSMVETNRTLLVQKITGEFFTARTNINPREKGILVMTAEDLAFISRCLRMGKSRTNKLVTVSAPGKKTANRPRAARHTGRPYPQVPGHPGENGRSSRVRRTAHGHRSTQSERFGLLGNQRRHRDSERRCGAVYGCGVHQLRTLC